MRNRTFIMNKFSVIIISKIITSYVTPPLDSIDRIAYYLKEIKSLIKKN